MIILIQAVLTLLTIAYSQTKNTLITGFASLPAIYYPTVIASSDRYSMDFNIFLIATVATLTVYCVEEFIKLKQNVVPRVLVASVTGYSLAFLTTLL